MTQWGIGGTLLFIGVVYSVVVFGINLILLPHVRFVIINPLVTTICGIVLILLGMFLIGIPSRRVMRHCHEGTLCTSGIYAYIRHPIYSCWILFITPGIVIITGCILGWTIPLFLYIAFRILITKEEAFLEERFGKKYLRYKHEVGRIFPKL